MPQVKTQGLGRVGWVRLSLWGIVLVETVADQPCTRCADGGTENSHYQSQMPRRLSLGLRLRGRRT